MSKLPRIAQSNVRRRDTCTVTVHSCCVGPERSFSLRRGSLQPTRRDKPIASCRIYWKAAFTNQRSSSNITRDRAQLQSLRLGVR